MENKKLSLEGILQAIANFNLEEDYDIDIVEVLKKNEEVFKNMGVDIDELGRLCSRGDKCLKK